MFKVDDLADKVSNMKLGDIIEMGSTEDDYNVDYTKHGVDEFEKVTVRFDMTLINATKYLLEKFRCSANTLMKSATKLGAMLMKEHMKIIEDIHWLLIDVIYKNAQDNGDTNTAYLVDVHTNDMMSTALRLKPKHYYPSRIVSIYPYPKWKLILDKYSWITYIPKSEIYRVAIAIAYGTEINLTSVEEYSNWVKIVSSEFLNIARKFCHVFKSSTSFMEYNYQNYVVNRVKGKELNEEVKRIIEEILLGD